jgi:putative endonuclease
MNKQGFVYILTNQHNKIFYVGVTSNLVKRIWEHKEKLVKGFTQKYKLYKLVYFEISDDINSAIIREKEIKSKTRNYKIELIEKMNPEYIDLYSTIL